METSTESSVTQFVLALVFAAAFFGGVLWLGRWLAARRVANWQNLALGPGLGHAGSGDARGVIAGSIDGLSVEIRRWWHDGNQSRVIFVIVKTTLAQPLPGRIAVQRSTVVDQLQAAMRTGERDIQLGDADFDKAFVVRGDEGVATWFHPDLRRALQACDAVAPGVRLETGEISWQGREDTYGVDKVAAVARAQIELAKALRR